MLRGIMSVYLFHPISRVSSPLLPRDLPMELAYTDANNCTWLDVTVPKSALHVNSNGIVLL